MTTPRRWSLDDASLSPVERALLRTGRAVTLSSEDERRIGRASPRNSNRLPAGAVAGRPAALRPMPGGLRRSSSWAPLSLGQRSAPRRTLGLTRRRPARRPSRRDRQRQRSLRCRLPRPSSPRRLFRRLGTPTCVPCPRARRPRRRLARALRTSFPPRRNQLRRSRSQPSLPRSNRSSNQGGNQGCRAPCPRSRRVARWLKRVRRFAELGTTCTQAIRGLPYSSSRRRRSVFQGAVSVRSARFSRLKFSFSSGGGVRPPDGRRRSSLCTPRAPTLTSSGRSLARERSGPGRPNL